MGTLIRDLCMGWGQWAQGSGALGSYSTCSNDTVLLTPAGFIGVLCELSFEERGIRSKKKKMQTIRLDTNYGYGSRIKLFYSKQLNGSGMKWLSRSLCWMNGVPAFREFITWWKIFLILKNTVVQIMLLLSYYHDTFNCFLIFEFCKQQKKMSIHHLQMYPY